jgi:hypothetical protein
MTEAPAGLRGKIRSLFLSPWAIVVAALALRLVVMRFTYSIQLIPLEPWRDHWAFGWETGRVARSIATGQGFSSPYPEPTGPTAHLAPVYPYLLAGVFKLFGIYTASSGLSPDLLDCSKSLRNARSRVGWMDLGFLSLLGSSIECSRLGHELDYVIADPARAGHTLP